MTIYELWEKVFPQEKRWLGLILFISLVGHLGAFFVFQIQPVDARTPMERPHRLTWVSAQSVQDGEMDSDPFAWIRWRDPSAIALPQSNVPEPPPFEELDWGPVRRALPPLSAFNPLERDEEGQETLQGAVLRSIREPEVEEMPLTMEAPPKLSGTVVVLRRYLEDREVLHKVELPRPETSESLRSSIYYVQVMPSGVVVNIRIEQSCGNTEIDWTGIERLRQWRFSPARQIEEPVWGRVEVFWDYREPNPDQVEFRF